MRILIANRGEIARRVIRTARRLGHETVAVYADPDATAPFVADADHAVRIGPASLAESYLSIERLLAACADTGADAVHPGYGFLSENADFAQAVLDAGLVWIGPRPGAIATMGSKIEARRLAAEARVPIIPGFSDSQEPDDLAAAAERIGYPVLVKAAAGGGGKGIRIAETPAHFAHALSEAVTEATRSFGDGRVIVERYITRPRHVEVQVVGDKHGTVIELGTRECSVQRRYQKLVEEAPAPNLPDSTETGLRTAALRLAESIGYDSTGTVEFVVDDETGDYFFLEMNTRLQVEHPVTEAITGLDLVELQIRAATSLPLGVAQDSVAFAGRDRGAYQRRKMPPTTLRPRSGRSPCSTFRTRSVGRCDRARLHDHAALRPDGRQADRARRDGRRPSLVLRRSRPAPPRWHRHQWRFPPLADRPSSSEPAVSAHFLDETELPVDNGVEAAAVAAHAGPGVGPWGAGDRRFTPHRPSRTVAMRDPPRQRS